MGDAGDGLSAIKRELLARLLKGDAPAPASRIPSAPTGEPVRLSFAQERVWLTSQLAGEVPAFNLGGAMRLRMRVDEDVLVSRLAEVVARHDSLRTAVRVVEGQPMLSVASTVPVTVPMVDVSGEADPQAVAMTWVREVILRPYRLDEAPLWRAVLIRVAAEEHILVVGAHHLVTDAASLMHLLREMALPDWRPSLPVSYADFAAWQRAQIEGGAYDEQLAFWHRTLADLPPPLELPTDRPRPQEPDYAGATLLYSTSPELGERIRQLSRAEDTTAYTVVLAALKVLLAGYTGQHDLAVGVQVSGRNVPELQQLIGMFVNVVPVRTSLAGVVTFREVLRRVRQQLTTALTYQEVPFEKLVHALRAGTDRSFPPLVQVACNMPMQDTDHPIGEEIPMPIAPGGSLLDLTVHVIPRPDGSLEIQFEYPTALFDEATVDRMARHYRRVLEAIAADPDIGLPALDLLDTDERAIVLSRGSGGAASAEALPELVARQVQATPYAVAVQAGPRQLTYAELSAAAGGLAAQLRANGVGSGHVVAICLDRGVELLTAALGVWRSGAAFLPLDPEYPPARWHDLLVQSGAVAVLTDESRRAALTEVAPAGCRTIDVASCPSEDGPTVEVMPQDAAYVMFTSGSTGRPKGVVVTHGAIANRICWSVGTQKLTADDRLLAKTRVGFDAAVLEWFAPLVVGGTVVMAPTGVERDPAALVRAVGTSGATILQLVPSVLRALLDQPGWSECTALRQVWSAGEPLDSALVRRLRDRAPVTVWNTYGPTECAIDVTALPAPDDQESGQVPIGRPLDGVRVVVLDRFGRLVPDGVVGELYVGGIAVGRGYLGQPDLTADRFVPDPFGPPGSRMYRTGDQVRWRDASVLEFVGRVDDQMKINGVRVEPAEVQAAFADHPDIRQVVVTGYRAADGSRRLVAYLVADRVIPIDELRDFGRDRLPEAMVPSVFVPLDALPLTDNGKVNRAALPVPDLSVARPEYLPPNTPAERLVAEVWAEVLGVERVGLHDDFFALGGHSLMLGQLAVRLRERSGVEVSIRDLFAGLTVHRQAALIAPDREEGPPPVTAVDRTRPLPLSFGQRRLWFLDQFNPNSLEYLTPMFLPLPGPVDAEHVRLALVDLVSRHEALRTRYVVTDGEPQQVIDPPGPVPLRVVDVPGAVTTEFFTEELSRGFDLAAGPMVRALLVRPADGDAILLILMHHISCDGWSTAVLSREFAELYAGHRAAAPVMLPPLAVQYADFAAWQLSWLSGDRLDRQLDYWREQLAGLPVLALPTDRVRPAVRDSQGGLVAFEVPEELARAVVEAGRRRGASAFMTLFTAFSVLLGRYTGQRDFAIGSPIAGRPRPELSDVVGIFINTLVLRCDLSGEPTFGELLDRVRTTTLAAFAHQDLPFERLVEEVQSERDLSRNPLYDALFDLHEEGHAGFVPGDKIEDGPLASRQDLGLIMRRQQDGSLRGMLEYATALFDRATVQRMVGHYLRLLEQIARDDDVPAARLELLTSAERHQLFGEWNDTTHPVPVSTLPELLRQQAARTPGAPALVFEGETLTYTELDDRANRLARLLVARGAGPERVVAVAAPRSLDLVIALVAVLKAGAAYLPVDPDYPAERIGFLLADAGAELVLTTLSAAPALPDLGVPVLVLDDPDTVAEAGRAPAGDVGLPGTAGSGGLDPAHPAYVIYTSGSTGRPKGAVVPHEGIVNRLLWMQQQYGLTADDRVLQKTPSSFDVSVWEFFWPLITGATLVIARPGGHRDPAYLADLIREQRITTLHFVPSMLEVFLREPAATGCTGLRRVICSGEALPPALRDRFFELFDVELHNLYGPTEASVDVTWWQCRRERAGEPVPIGRPVWNTRLYVLDAELRPVPPGVPGELHLAGVQLARGYLRRSALTAERFVPDPFGPPGSRMYRTGDVVRWRADGAVEYLGRTDHQVKIRGHRVEPGEIESVLSGHRAVGEALVLAYQLGEETRLVAYWVAAAAEVPTDDELIDHCRAELPEAMVPQLYVRLDRFPLTANGKVDRAALPAPEMTSALGGQEMVAPRTVVEERIAEVWAELLDIEVGVHHNFFRVGGHSLLAVRLNSRIQEEFDVDLPLRTIFEEPTIAQLAAAVEAAIRAEIEALSDAEVAALSDNFDGPAPSSGEAPPQ